METALPQKHTTAQKMSRRRNKRPPALQGSRKTARLRGKITKRLSRGRKSSADHAERAIAKNGARIHSRRRRRLIRDYRTELDVALQRFVDLYDFAPIAYVSFNRSGRIEEANLAATELLGAPRDLLIGRPFAVYVADLDLFLKHLVYCRTSQRRVETELQLKPSKGERIPVQLISAPIASTMRNGAPLYQTAIINLRERKAAEEALRHEERKLARELEDLKQLQQISSQLIEQHNSEAIYTQIVDAAIALLRADMGSLQTFLPDSAELLLLASRGFDPSTTKAWKRVSVRAGTVCAEALRRGERVIVHDVRQNDFLKNKKMREVFRRCHVRAVQSTPLISRKGQLVGMLSNHWRQPHQPSVRELRLLDVLRRQAADLLERVHAEEALRESEARMRATVEQATAGVARCDTTGRITFANGTLCQMLGYTQSELIGKSFAELTHPDHVKDNIRRFAQMIRDAKPYEIEKRYICKDGSILWADVSASAVPGTDGKTQSAVSVIVDITSRKRAEAALRRSKQLLELRVRARTLALRNANTQLESEIARRKGLEGEILAVSDREQQRLGQELHDGLCQHLTAVAFMARSVALRLRNHRVIDAADIEKIAELVNNAATDTRELSRALHRIDVDAVGLSDALQDLVNREIWKTPCRLEVKPSFQLDDDAVAAQVYRIAREAVINANKHAQAREIVVKLERSGKEMVLHVIDDGAGFSNAVKVKHGLGRHIMNYRARLIGGRLEIKSQKRRGTRVSCFFPNSIQELHEMDRNGNDKTG
jgi:PAS domain S-box-containing protein